VGTLRSAPFLLSRRGKRRGDSARFGGHVEYEPTPTSAVMEGQGAYNQHAKLQAGGAALALPLLEEATQKIPLDDQDQRIVVADYGSSQGKNSLAPVGIAIKTFRRRFGPDRAILVFHVDQPENDFNSLFEVVGSDPSSYVSGEPNVFPCAIGRSFYKQVLPHQSVHLGWSSYAVVWLSQVPAKIPGHFVVVRSSGSVRAAFDRQGAQDWEAFLTLRANELRPGGRLVVVLPALNDDERWGFEELFDHANSLLSEMVDQGTLGADERERMVLGTFYRRRCDLLAPFQRDGKFQDLTAEACEVSLLADAAWSDYQHHRNKEMLAAQHAMFFRATFMPSLASALRDPGDAERRHAFARDLEAGLKRLLAQQPVPVHSYVTTIVLAKHR